MKDMKLISMIMTLVDPYDNTVNSYLNDGWQILSIATGPVLTGDGGKTVSYVMGR